MRELEKWIVCTVIMVFVMILAEAILVVAGDPAWLGQVPGIWGGGAGMAYWLRRE